MGELQDKANLAARIFGAIERRALQRADVAVLLGTDRATLDALLRGDLDDLPVTRLVEYLIRLGHDVEFVVTSTPTAAPRAGTATVHIA